MTLLSDQGGQYPSHDCQSFLKDHGKWGSLSRRGNCDDNAVAESFLQLLERECIKRTICATLDAARAGISDYTGMFDNRRPICRLYFNRAQKYIGLPDSDNNETRHPDSSPEDIYGFAEQLKTTVTNCSG